MRYLLLRDDDTNATTAVSQLERLYRPFLDRQLPVNLAVIPLVNLDAVTNKGERENFLPPSLDKNAQKTFAAIGSNRELVDYLLENRGFCIAQHGCHHDFHEFLIDDREEIVRRLQLGSEALLNAGFSKPTTFVAPQDKLSSVAFQEAVRRYRVISTGWFERARLPLLWWPRYCMAKFLRQDHWQMKGCQLLSREGSPLSRIYRPEVILDALKERIHSQSLTIINTHWWEFFPGGEPDELFIEVLHSFAEYLAGNPEIRVITFDEVHSALF